MEEQKAEEILIQQAKEGNRRAFETLAEKYAKRLYNLALRLCCDAALAQDIAQDALVAAYKGMARFDFKSPFYGWLYRITVNTWKNRVRYEKRRKFFSHFSIFDRKEDDENEAAYDIKDESAGADEEFEKKDRKDKVWSALKQLDDMSREMIVLRDMQELSYEEIGAALGINEGTVKSRLSRARQKLKELLEGEL